MLSGITPKCWILALVVRDDGERILLGDGAFEFQDKQQHFIANTYVNDTVEVQGNDGVLLAGQVRRGVAQPFDGYIADSTVGGSKTEEYRRQFISFFRKNHFYTVIYVLPDGAAVKRQKGFIIDAPSVEELYQISPKYHVSLNFEDVNYYAYSENSAGEEIYGNSASVPMIGAASGGLVWDENGVVWESSGTKERIEELLGDIQQTGTPSPDSSQVVKISTGLQTLTIGGVDFNVNLDDIELGDISGYQDRIYKDGSKWYVRKIIKKIRLTSSQGWTINNQITGATRYVAGISDVVLESAAPNTKLVYSNYFIGSRANDVINANVDANRICVVSNHRIVVKTIDSDLLALSDFKNWLDENQVFAYYVLESPELTEIADTNLTAQLETLFSQVLEEGTQVTVDGDLAVEVETATVDSSGGAVWEGNGGGGVSELSVDGIDNAYPMVTITGPANSPTIENISTNTSVHYSGNIPEGQELKIDSNTQTAKLNGTSVISNLSGDWLYLSPGQNRISYSTSNSDAPDAVIEWSEVVG